MRIESEWPPCSSWDGPESSFGGPLEWAGSYKALQRTGGLAAAGEARETVYVLAFHGRQPRFAKWRLDFRFGEASGELEVQQERPVLPLQPEPAASSAPTATAEASPARPPKEQVVPVAGGACRSSDDYWWQLNSPPDCIASKMNGSGVRFEFDLLTWSGECREGYSEGPGILHWNDGWDEEHEHEGLMRQGTREGRWVFRGHWGSAAETHYVDGQRHGTYSRRTSKGDLVTFGEYVNGKREGHWIVRQDILGWTDEGAYIDGKREGYWITRWDSGETDEGRYANDKREGRWVTRYPDGTTYEEHYVDGIGQDR